MVVRKIYMSFLYRERNISQVSESLLEFGMVKSV